MQINIILKPHFNANMTRNSLVMQIQKIVILPLIPANSLKVSLVQMQNVPNIFCQE